MAAYTEIGYSVADIAALKAIAPSDRPAFAGALVYVVSTNQWFEFVPSGSSGGITPNSGSGRWYALHRETLIADRTYFVRTDGNDNNDGLANTGGGAFLTVAKFFSVLATLDKNGFDVICQIADGTYTLSSSIQATCGIGSGTVYLRGNLTTPTNVLFESSTSAINFIAKSDSNTLYVQGIRFNSTASSSALVSHINCTGGIIAIDRCDFGNCSNGVQINCSANGVVYLVGNYTVSGGGGIHYGAFAGGLIRDWLALNPSGSTITVTVTGTPNFLNAFAFSRGVSMIDIFFNRITYSGSATGLRYSASANGVIATFGGGDSYFPGNASGTTAIGGQYV